MIQLATGSVIAVIQAALSKAKREVAERSNLYVD
jgi:hypothetical protein